MSELLGRGTSGIARSIAGQISTIGNIGIISNGLDSLPISDIGADEIDLGEINLNEETFESDISSETAAEELGYSEIALSTYGSTDGTLMQYLNPDIDRNGVYDVDESLNWALEAVLDIPIFKDDYNYESGQFVNDLTNFENIYNAFFVISLSSNLPEFPVESIQLKLPDSPQAYDSNNQPIDYLPTDYVEHVEGYRVYSFFFMNIDNPTTPISGNYIFINGTENYYFDNLEFISINSNFDGYIFPIIQLSTDINNIYTNIAWKWLKISDGMVSHASYSEVSLYIQKIDFYIGDSGYTDPIDLGVDPYEENNVDISHLNQEELSTFIFQCVTKGNTFLRFHFEDINRPY